MLKVSSEKITAIIKNEVIRTLYFSTSMARIDCDKTNGIKNQQDHKNKDQPFKGAFDVRWTERNMGGNTSSQKQKQIKAEVMEIIPGKNQFQQFPIRP